MDTGHVGMSNESTETIRRTYHIGRYPHPFDMHSGGAPCYTDKTCCMEPSPDAALHTQISKGGILNLRERTSVSTLRPNVYVQRMAVAIKGASIW